MAYLSFQLPVVMPAAGGDNEIQNTPRSGEGIARRADHRSPSR